MGVSSNTLPVRGGELAASRSPAGSLPLPAKPRAGASGARFADASRRWPLSGRRGRVASSD